MKLLFLLIILPFTLNAQIFKPEDHYPLKNGRPIYEEIIEITGKSKDVLYANSKKWIVDNFKSSEAVIQSEEKEIGQIILIGIGGFKNDDIIQNHRFKFNVQIECKDNKCRIRIYNIKRYFGQTSIISTNNEDEVILNSNSKPLSSSKFSKTVEFANKFNSFFKGIISSYKESILRDDEF